MGKLVQMKNNIRKIIFYIGLLIILACIYNYFQSIAYNYLNIQSDVNILKLEIDGLQANLLQKDKVIHTLNKKIKMLQVLHEAEVR